MNDRTVPDPTGERSPAAGRGRPPKSTLGLDNERLRANLVEEAACGMVAEQLDVDIDTAARVLEARAHHTGCPASDVASAVVGRALAVGWIGGADHGHGPSAPTSTLAVLYIEDETANAVLMQRIFNLWPSYHLVTTANGRDGLDLIHRSPPDLLLLDGNLPDLDGSEVLRQIRDDPDIADLPVIVISADASRTRIDRLTALGANEYLVKPFAIDHLERLIIDLTRSDHQLTEGR
jgi:CheY-like chemotaxis protein